MATPSPVPTFTPTPGPTPTPTPRLTPTPRPTPTPTSAERLAFERLSEVILWFTDPPDQWHAEAVTALVKTGAKNLYLGEAVARVPWVNDGISVHEIRLIWYVRDRAHADPTARVVQGRYWLDAGPRRADVRMARLEMLVLVADAAKRNPALVQTLQELPQIAGNVMDDSEMGYYFVRVADHSVEAALTAAVFANDDPDTGRELLFALSSLARDRDTTEQFDRLVATPWFVDGLDEAEVALVMVLRGAARQDPERFNELLEAGAVPTSQPALKELHWGSA